MKENDTIIRPETRDDHRKTENLTREAFWNVYRPGCGEHYVLHCLREDPAFVPELDLVMERDGELIGQVIYLRAEIACDDGRKLPVMTFGPIGIAPQYQHRGYGKRLLDFSLERAKALGAGAGHHRRPCVLRQVRLRPGQYAGHPLCRRSGGGLLPPPGADPRLPGRRFRHLPGPGGLLRL